MPQATCCPHVLQAFTFRGNCAQCHPVLHQAYSASRQAFDAALSQYLRDTGHEPLADWDGFEAWLEKSPEGETLARALLALDAVR